MSTSDLSEEDVSSLVRAAEGAFAELSSLSRSTDEEELQASVEQLLERETDSPCCLFATRVTAANAEAATALLDIALSSEFRK